MTLSIVNLFDVNSAWDSGKCIFHVEVYPEHTAVVVVVVVVVTRTLTRVGGMAKNYGALEAGRLPRAWTRVPIKSRHRVSDVESVAGQFRMR